MKEQINRYARGAFEYNPLKAEIFPDSVQMVVDKNKPFTGQLHIKESLGRTMKGLLYSSNDRVQLMMNQFIGNDNIIEYTIDCEKIEAGDHLTGFFGIITNGGEEKIPYEFQIEAGSYESELGDVRNLFHFANLAQTDMAEAVRIFTMEEFNQVFLKDDLVMSRLHDELLAGTDDATALEEFLVAIHKKARVNLSLSQEEGTFEFIQEDMGESVVISKDIWGRIDIQVKTDCDFIELTEMEINQEDFVGGKFEYHFFIRKEKLHAGKNQGKITFNTAYQQLDYTVTVDNSRVDILKERNLEEKRNLVKLIQVYMDFRLHRCNIGKWIADTKEALEALLKIDEENPYYALIMSQVLITDKKMNEAKYYLESAKDAAVEGREKDTPLYCYYLYVNTIFNRDSTYARETAALVKNIYERECRNQRILWVLLYLDEEMSKNKSLKLLRIKEQFKAGMRSPVLYLEACAILNEQPMLLRVLNEFELSVLLFGCREGILENRLIKQTIEVAAKAELGTMKFIRLLKKLYHAHPDNGVLEALCGLLIKNGMTGKECLEWYGLGIAKELRVTKLFEYYMASRELKDDSPLPKMVLLYFGYHNDLDCRHKAYLYANVIRYKNENPQIYKNYTPQMEEFINEQLQKGRNDRDTALVFQNFLTCDLITGDNAEGAVDAVFTYRLECSNKAVRNVIVGHKETLNEDIYPMTDGVAYVRIFTEEPCICFEDSYGRRYSESMDYHMERLYSDEAVLKKLCLYCPENLKLALYFSEKTNKYQDASLDAVRRYHFCAKSPYVRMDYKRKLIGAVIDYYFDSYEGAETQDILESIEINDLTENYIAKFAEALMVQGDYERSYETTKLVRIEKLNPKRMLRLCDKLIAGQEHLEEIHFLKLAYYAFSKGKYDDDTLKLLTKSYNGITDEMIELWEAAKDNNIDTYDLEERILGQMLFSRHYSATTIAIFEHYYDNGAKERLVEAYLGYSAYIYFVKEALISDTVFEIIEARLDAEKDVILVCKLALLKFYSTLDKLGATRKELTELLIKELSVKGYVFPFYKEFADKMVLPFNIADKTMVEYRSTPDRRVVIHYIYENSGKKKNYTAMDMKNVYEGIFVKEFVLFYGESIQYYITEEDEDGETATESSRIENRFVNSEHEDGRYEAINDILACRQLHDTKSLDKWLQMYGVYDVIVNQIFKPME